TARMDTRTRRRNGAPLRAPDMGKRYFTLRSDAAYQLVCSLPAMKNANAPHAVRRLVVLAGTGLIAAGCGGLGSAPAARPGSAAPAASAPAASASAMSPAPGAGTESPPPGDIPDSTVYVAYHPTSGRYAVKVPEGWARTVTPGAVSFTDKLNSITVTTIRAAAPTAASARVTEVPQIQGSAQHFTLAGISMVSRSAGPAILIRYSTDSQPDLVTGKVYTDAVERYEFYRNGTEAIVTLSGPAGADNVDPWRTVTNSFQWLS
ncbi:MAG TPA: hypothetical protein VF482_01350, partial [Trebonia sp.]